MGLLSEMKWTFPWTLWFLMSSNAAISAEQKVGPEHWSFQMPQAAKFTTSIPATARTRIDVLIQRGLEAQGLEQAPAAGATTQLRRLYVVLSGLPPNVEEQQHYAADNSPNRNQRLADRLLASYAFGERMASFWLPIARYAEDQAHQVGNNAALTYPNAHLYRQWVIDAFNRDVAYDDFIEWQLAADFYPQARESEVNALGFLGVAPKYYNRGRLDVMADEWEDRVDTVTRSFLGLTVACARCHDHKYDPISTEDYYALAGVFASTEMLNEQLPDVVLSDKEAKKNKVAPKHARHVVKDGKAKNLPVYIRGDVSKPGAMVPRRFLHVLSQGKAKPFQEGSGRRELAEAITNSENPLTARVMVNRLWGEIFGQPLIATTSNFGALGDRPQQQVLLDDLAASFAQHLSVKKQLLQWLQSATFRQASTVKDPSVLENDPANHWWARMPRRRLSFEMWRDTVLAISGALDPSGGASLEMEDPANSRRTVYARISRLDLNDVMEQFDYPDPNIHAGVRSKTTTTTQKLYLLNHPFVLDQAERMAERAAALASQPQGQINWLYQSLYSRAATESERDKGLAFLTAEDTDTQRLTKYTQVLLCANEMLYLD